MLRAADSVRRDARHAAAPCLCDAVMAVDEVVAAGRNFREDHGALQIRCDQSLLIETGAMAGVGHAVQRDEFRAESCLGK